MKRVTLLIAAAFIIAQLPLAALAGVAPAGVSEVSSELLLTVTGGACTSCHDDSHPPPDRPPEAPRPVGNTYWELTRTVRVQTSHPGYQIVYNYRNMTTGTRKVTFAITERNAFNWSITAGVPSSIVSASLGRAYDVTSTRTVTGDVSPGMRYVHYLAHPTERYQHTFTRFQDWSDGSREVIDSGGASSTRIYPDEFSVEVPF